MLAEATSTELLPQRPEIVFVCDGDEVRRAFCEAVFASFVPNALAEEDPNPGLPSARCRTEASGVAADGAFVIGTLAALIGDLSVAPTLLFAVSMGPLPQPIPSNAALRSRCPLKDLTRLSEP